MAEDNLDTRKIVFNKDATASGADSMRHDNELILVSKTYQPVDRDGNLLSSGKIIPFDPERMGMLQFLVGEARVNPDWKIVHYELMLQHRIKPQDVNAELERQVTETERRLNRFETKEKTFRDANSQQKPYSKPADVVIYCWPYHAHSNEGQPSFKVKSATTDPVVLVVTIFGAVWLILTLLMLGVHNFGGIWYLFKLIPFIILPALGLLKGLTHIRLAREGVVLQSIAGKSTLKAKTFQWHEIKRVYVQPARNEQDVLSSKLVIDTSRGKCKIALKKIASASQWRKLVAGLSERVAVCDLNPALLDGLSREISGDPTYTKIWLEALTAPPHRERLQPLNPDTELQKGLYKIQSLLGSGGQGSAYLASTRNEHGALENIVLKEYILPVYVDVKVKRQALEDFEHESKIMRSLNHPGIVKTRGSFVEDHRAYLILEYVDGKSLKQLVDERGPLPEKDCIRFGMEMCDILHYLHAQMPPVVHRDFTPDNLLVSQGQSLKLIDFMVARQSETEAASSSVVGKHHYMPPEQFRGRSTTKSDIYALGCTLHLILTGCKPEPMSTSHPTLQNEHVSGGMTSIVEKATALDQNLRYQNVMDLKDDLSILLSSQAATLSN